MRYETLPLGFVSDKLAMGDTVFWGHSYRYIREGIKTGLIGGGKMKVIKRTKSLENCPIIILEKTYQDWQIHQGLRK